MSPATRIVAGAGLMIALASCSSGPGQVTVKGQVMGVTSDSAYTVGKAMNLMPSVCDITPGSEVKILGAQGQELGFATLQPGRVIPMPGTGGQGAEILTFTVSVAAGQSQYAVEVGGQQIPMSPAQIAAPKLTCS